MLKKGVPLWVFILALLAVTSTAFAIMVIRTQWSIQSGFQVHIYELKVYETDGVTECNKIDWGCLGQGSSDYHDIIANNTGDYSLNLKMNTTLDISGGTVSWNYSGFMLKSHEIMALRLTLSINNTAPRDLFNFTINIYGWVSG